MENNFTEPDIYTRLLQLGTATLYEASGLDCDLDPAIRSFWQDACLCGPALPVLAAAGDNLPLHLAVAHAQPGEILVVNAAGTQYGYWGEILTIAAQLRGIAGLVIDGAVRDTRRIEELHFPVFSNGIAIRRTTKRVAGVVGDPVTVGGILIQRGDLIVADADGIISLPQKEISAILQAAEARATKEQDVIARLHKGELTTTIYGLHG